MASSNHSGTSQYLLESLTEYVFTPSIRARDALETERNEVIVERDAFKEFRKRVLKIPTQESNSPHQSVRVSSLTPDSNRIGRVRDAYRDTVMNVPHYDRQYGESLTSNFAAEFDAQLAYAIHEESPVSFTEPFKTKLQAAAAVAVENRECFLDTLAEERQSIETATESIKRLVDRFETSRIPRWEHDDITDEIESLSDERQQFLRSRDSGVYSQDTSLCKYLYADYSWTYPVLTMIVRFQETVTREV